MSSRGFMTDMVSSVSDKIAGTDHVEELLRKEEDPEKVKQIKEIKDKALYLRRKQQSRLLYFAENPNPDWHCPTKHFAGSFIKDVEVYEATGEDEDLEIAKESADLLAMVLSMYLGMEFEKCAACLWDKFMVQQYEMEHFAKIKVNDKGEKNGNKSNECRTD